MQRIKRSLCLLLALMITAALGAFPVLAAEEPSVAAAALVLGDLDTGEILYEKDADTVRAPASLTKIMTVLLAVEAIEAGQVSGADLVTAGQDCRTGLDNDSSTADIVPGETMSLLDLLYCAMLSSANESCNIIASYLCGSVAAFVQRMNERAAVLGCTATNFADPNGLSDENHYSTARDLFRIACEAMQHPLFAEICAAAEYETAETNVHEARWLENSNALLNPDSVYGAEYVYNGCVGLKTGYTGDAGYCLASAVRRDGLGFLAIVLGCDGVNNGGEGYGNFAESIKLYDWAYSQYEQLAILSPDAVAHTVKVPNGRPASLPLYPAEPLMMRASRTGENEPMYTYSVDADKLVPPLESGSTVGTVTVTMGAQSRTVTLVTHETLRHSLFASIWLWMTLLLALIAFVIVWDVRMRRRKRAGQRQRSAV